MKKTLSKLLALALTASLVLSGCGGNAEGGNNEANSQGGQANAEGSDKKEEASSKDEIKDLYIARNAVRELETFNILYTQRQEDSENLTSLVDGLLESNPAGSMYRRRVGQRRWRSDLDIQSTRRRKMGRCQRQ